tara:strand:- start:5 stop:592 length:588 start_codon:yes stop_codon:yes gene_type:complete
MKSIKFTITGIRPMLLHNGLMADPTNPFTVAIKKITSKGSKKMTEADYKERDRLEWEAGLYWSETEGAIAIPSDNIERCIQEGAKKNRLGKDFAAGVLLSEPEVVLQHRRAGKTKEEIYSDPAYTLRKGVKVQLSRVIRIRPMIPPGWKLTFTVEFDEEIVNAPDVIEAVQKAGALIGMGDWRPKFGRFSVEVVG